MAAPFSPAARTAPTIVSGYRDPSSTVSQRVKPDISDKIIEWEPEAAPLLAFTKAVRQKAACTQRQFDILESEPFPRELTVSGALAPAATALVLAAGHGGRITDNALLRHRVTGELILVSSVANDTATVVRGIGAAGGYNIADGDVLEIVGNSYEDAGGAKTSKTVKESRDYNLTQIVRTPFSISGRQGNTAMYGGNDRVWTTRKMGVEHKKSLEYLAFHGRRHSRTGAGGLEQTFTGGLDFFCTSNVWDLGNIEPSWRSFVEAMEGFFRWGDGGIVNGNGMKYAFCSPRWLTVIESWAHEKIRIVDSPEVKKLGIEIKELLCAHGTLRLVRQPLFTGADAGLMYIVDLNHIRYRFHQGRDTRLNENIQAPDIDGETHEWFTDAGFEITIEGAHGIVKNLPVA